jgi:hypothetical protein
MDRSVSNLITAPLSWQLWMRLMKNVPNPGAADRIVAERIFPVEDRRFQGAHTK